MADGDPERDDGRPGDAMAELKGRLGRLRDMMRGNDAAEPTGAEIIRLRKAGEPPEPPSAGVEEASAAVPTRAAKPEAPAAREVDEIRLQHARLLVQLEEAKVRLAATETRERQAGAEREARTAASAARLDSVRNDLAAARQQMGELQGRLDAMNGELGHSRRDRAALRAARDELRRERDEARAALERLGRELEAEVARREALSFSYRRQAEAAGERMAVLSQRLGSVGEDLARTREKRAELSAALERMRGELSASGQRHRDLAAALERARKDHAESMARQERTLERIADANRARDLLAERRLDAARAELGEALARSGELSGLLHGREQELKETRRQRDELQARIEAVQAELGRLAAAEQESRGRTQALASRVEALTTERQALAAAHAALQAELEAERRRRDHLLASPEWRLTAPLRALVRLLRPHKPREG